MRLTQVLKVFNGKVVGTYLLNLRYASGLREEGPTCRHLALPIGQYGCRNSRSPKANLGSVEIGKAAIRKLFVRTKPASVGSHSFIITVSVFLVDSTLVVKIQMSLGG